MLLQQENQLLHLKQLSIHMVSFLAALGCKARLLSNVPTS